MITALGKLVALDLGKRVTNVLEGMAGTQKRVLGRLEKRADWNMTKLNKGMCEFLHLGWNNPVQH